MTDIYFDLEGSLSAPLHLRVRAVSQTSMGFAADLSDYQCRRIRQFMRGVLGYCRPYVVVDGIRHTYLTTIGNILKFWRDEND